MLQMAGGASSSIGDRFFLGQGSLRGFGFGGFGPRDLNTPNNSPLGGNSFVAWRTDIQMPYLVGEASTVVPGVFLDLGSIWDLNSVAGGANGTQIVDDSLNLRASLGISVQFNTAVGPISVSMAHAAKKERYDQTQTLMFSYNRSF
jgi:outer membrane protein insertion porin family